MQHSHGPRSGRIPPHPQQTTTRQPHSHIRSIRRRLQIQRRKRNRILNKNLQHGHKHYNRNHHGRKPHRPQHELSNRRNTRLRRTHRPNHTMDTRHIKTLQLHDKHLQGTQTNRRPCQHPFPHHTPTQHTPSPGHQPHPPHTHPHLLIPSYTDGPLIRGIS